MAISTYEDWKTHYDAGATKQTFVDCHMLALPGKQEVALQSLTVQARGPTASSAPFGGPEAGSGGQTRL